MSSFWKIISAAFAGFVAIVALLGNLDGARKGWCDNIGLLCSSEITSPVTTRATTLGNNCKSDDRAPLCLEPTTKYRRLDTSSIQFLVTTPGGPVAIAPATAVDNNAGWFHGPKDEVSSSKICITVFARTLACEHPQKITGSLKAIERITIF
jgi:hypothetical protein